MQNARGGRILVFAYLMIQSQRSPSEITTDGLGSYKAAMRELDNTGKQEVGQKQGQKQGRKRPPTVPTKRAGDAAFSKNEIATEVRFNPCQRPQALQLAAPPSR